MSRKNRGASTRKGRGKRPTVTKLHERLVVCDIQNIVGGAVHTVAQAIWARRIITDRLQLTTQDQVVIGASHYDMVNVGVAWPNARCVLGSGADGADLALLDVLAENVDGRFAEVIFVTGDGIFADEAEALAAADVRVTVAAYRENLSQRLKRKAAEVIYLDELPAAPLHGTAKESA